VWDCNENPYGVRRHWRGERRKNLLGGKERKNSERTCLFGNLIERERAVIDRRVGTANRRKRKPGGKVKIGISK